MVQIIYDPTDAGDAGNPTTVFGHTFFPGIEVTLNDVAVAKKLAGNPQFRVLGGLAASAIPAAAVVIPVDWRTWGAIQQRNLARAIDPEVSVKAEALEVQGVIEAEIAKRAAAAAPVTNPALPLPVPATDNPPPPPPPTEHDPSKVAVPEGWAELHWSKRAALAREIQPDPAAAISNAEEADAVITAELIRRGEIQV